MAEHVPPGWPADLGTTNGFRITNTTFDHNAIYDIEENADSNDSGMVYQGNSFGRPVYTLADSTPAAPVPDGWREVTIGGYGIAVTSSQITGNTFVNGRRSATPRSGGRTATSTAAEQHWRHGERLS